MVIRHARWTVHRGWTDSAGARTVQLDASPRRSSTNMQIPHVPVDPEFTRALDRHGRLPRDANRVATLLASFLASDFHLTATGSLPNNVKVKQAMI